MEGRAEKHGFEYLRNGTLSLDAALNPQTGEVIGQTGRHGTLVSLPVKARICFSALSQISIFGNTSGAC